VEIWVERFQCLRGDVENTDAVVQVYFKKRIDGHNLEGLEEHQFRLSHLHGLGELLNVDFVLELEKTSKAQVPAAGRTVSINHNSVAYSEADKALGDLEEALKGSNESELQQAQTEVSAVRRLLQSTQVRIWALTALAGPTLMYLAKKALDTGISKLATTAWDKLVALVGMIF